MIDIRDLTVKYKSERNDFLALDNFNLLIKDGDICAVIGPSGCGKSTLLHVLSGIIKDYAGSVLIDGKDIDPRVQRIGLVMQSNGLLPWRDIYFNSTIGARVKDGNNKLDKQYANYILNKLGIGEMTSRFPNQLSGGQRQRAEIARAFILKPNILLMDEPFSALDALTREEMQDLFLKIWIENSVSTLFVTHSIEEALYVGKKIVIMSKSPGNVVGIYDNPLFGKKDLRLDEEYYKFSIKLRKIAKEEWSK
jgi:NitT/TauT family transport system ATP-binding protein